MTSKKQLPFSVPTGYFESLPERVVARCEATPTYTPRWVRVRSQLALAASFALLVGLSYLGAKNITGLLHDNDDTPTMMAYAVSSIYVANYEDYADDDNNTLDEEAIVEYLLCTAASGELLEN
jgi:hypothetical protein